MNEDKNTKLESGNSHDNRRDTIIIVNGRERKAKSKELTFDQVVELAFGQIDLNPNICYTITYKRGPGQNPEGSMVEGDSVIINKGMIFNVTRTDKS
ncbi:multiubiquitin domain-containing protein [Reichenbachiella sp.]|uniref:multiubiquitin domain-containing protein n=1 Tax=Reichenbachiella sp. TaxID=2184521 RepID=UPI003298C7E4